ncbi:MAG: N-succinylarginine dihydrolase [Polyangiaceae bacterium]|nr:N-succinylarginine dihydrolase [Myxococcales bacterium]MCB9589343.1 N-succinylarginine dihydrolase [Polyangiaceae bacterium]
MSTQATRELNFDGLPGPSHNFAGLSPGNIASTEHAGHLSNPKSAALQGLEKMRFVRDLGIAQAVLPPQPRPDVGALRRLGFVGEASAVLRQAAEQDEQLLRLCSSASAMWTANAATVAPSTDAADGRTHLTPANLSAMFHRSLEAPTTTRVLRRIFADEARFEVHDALPSVSHFADEGAANHTRLYTPQGATHLFGWGRRAYKSSDDQEPGRFPARQTYEASRAVARLHQLGDRALLWQQAPRGIDDGAFHTDVLAVGSANLLLLHELAFVDTQELLEELKRRLGDSFQYCLAKQGELPAADAVAAYPFNSQLLELPNGEMAIVAPEEAKQSAAAHRFLERVVAEDNRVSAVHYLDVNQSMKNGGGPACLRLRVPLEDADVGKLGARVLLDDALYSDLKSWVERHYRDRLSFEDLLDVAFLREVETALDELTQLLGLGSVYDFQNP